MNAREEFLDAIEETEYKVFVKCAMLKYKKRQNEICLKVGYSDKDFEDFLNEISQISIEYDEEYWGPEISGAVWFTDGTWLERVMDGGCEYWEHKKCPEIPVDLY